LCAALSVALGGAACLPADTRPVPGSILLLATSEDEPSTTTADGWTITIDRLVLGLGNASFVTADCSRYSEAHYVRLLDGRLVHEQKISILYGLGQCNFGFQVLWPGSDTLLGEGVTEADRQLMVGGEVEGPPGPRREGIAVDFAATATRGGETKRMHWPFGQATTNPGCMRSAPDATMRSLELESGQDLTLHLGVRGVTLFGDDADPDDALLRFDAIAAADTHFGNADGDVALDELGDVTLEAARQFAPGRYAVGREMQGGTPHSLEDYIHLVLLRRLVGFREDIACSSFLGFGRPPR
jgi:hypothetical protein